MLSSCVCIGVNTVTREGYLLSFIGRIKWRLMNPICNCLVCMGSVWGVICFLAFLGLDKLYQLPLFCLSLSGLNAVVEQLLKLVHTYIVYLNLWIGDMGFMPSSISITIKKDE